MDFELDLFFGVPLLVNLLFNWFSKHCSNPTLMVASQVAVVCPLLLLGSSVKIALNVSTGAVRRRPRDFNFPNILLFLLLASLWLPPDTFWYAYLMILIGSSPWSRRLLAVLSGYLISLHTYLAALVTGVENHQTELPIGGHPVLVTGTENHQIELSIGGLVTGTGNHQTEQSIGGQGPLFQIQFNEDDDEVSDIYFGHA